MKTLTGLDGRTEPSLTSGHFFELPSGVSSRTSTDLNPSGCDEMSWGRGLFIEDSNQSASGWWQPVCHFAWLRTHAQRHLVLHMACCMSRTHAGRHHSSQMSGCMTATHARHHSITHMAGRILRLHAQRHLVLLQVRMHVQLPCTATPHASRDTQLVRWLTPCSEPMQRATSRFSFRGKLHAEETSFFQSVELLNRRASKNVMLPKRPSNQSKTSSNYGRATYSTHSLLTINSSPISYFKASRSILIARDSTTTKILDHSFFLKGSYNLGLQIGNAPVLVDFHVLDIKLNLNSSLLLGRAFLSTVGAVCNLQTNQLCLILINPNAHYELIPVKKPLTISRRINDAGIIAACHCGDEYETEYSASIETHTATSIDSGNQKSTDIPHDESIDSSPDEWENDYYNPTIDAYTRQNMHTDEYGEDFEEERAIEYRAILDEEDKLLHHSSWKRNAPSFDMADLPSIDTQPQQRCRKRASTDTSYYKSVDIDLNRLRDGDYSIGSWADEHHHKSFAVETVTYTPRADKLQDSFTYEELLNMQKRDDTYQFQAEAAWGRTRFSQSIDTRYQQSINKLPQQSINNSNTTSIDNHSMPKTTVSEKDKLDNQYLTLDEFDIFKDPNGYAKAIDGRTLHKTTKEFYDTAGGIENSFKQRSRNTTHPSINIDVPTVTRQPKFGKIAYDPYGNWLFYWEEKDEYGVYRDDREFARDLDGHTIPVHNKDIRRLLDRASRDEPAYICLPQHASQFTQTKLVPEIYTKDEINEMFYGVCGEHDRNKEAFQMKLGGVYYPLNDSIIWLTTCMEEMKKDIARIQNATSTARPPSIDRRQPQSIDNRQLSSLDRHHYTTIDNRLTASIDTNPPRPHTMKSQPNFPTREEIDQLVEGIYRALETTEERLDERCDDIYFPMDLTISALTSKVEAIQGELVEILSYIARRPEASISIDRRNNKSFDTNHSTSINSDTNRGRLVPKMTSDMSNTPYHGKEISADTYATLTTFQFNLESLGERLQRIENTTAAMKQ
ncbi:hypothetical protein DY000_02054930 [Brassica cretica]|uniref:Uncharacterized protein n=1 Tax=Brassica cretica TaxID=69181 RepID=A0ABQ7AK50_BRACR|nr:hypothetical protein DY000_02054930 [Brassica cretica]